MNDIESLLKEKRVFKPSADFAKNANWKKKTVRKYRELGEKDPERFWAKMAKQNVTWFSPWKKVLAWKPPFARWFIGGKLNVSYNCLDRHIEGEGSWRRNKAAIVWEGEPGDIRTITFGELHREVCKFANVLKARGVKKGDRVALYMQMIPELAIAILACTRIGAPHSVVFGGFSAESLRDRINDAKAKLLITADHGNCEFMRNKDGSPHTAHTTNLVEVFYVAEDAAKYKVGKGILADVAPTLLAMLGQKKPAEMTGKSLLKKK